ncbi:MAG: hypothetical protein M3458_00170 [Acidobacteriota bacterium]|nr:hypothetical protein [Acidobacteriota bacterium]
MQYAGGMKDFVKVGVVVCAVAMLFWHPRRLFSQGPIHGQPQPAAEWKPTQSAPPGARFAGDGACAKCHTEKVTTFQNSGMSNALSSAADSNILHSNAQMKFSSGGYSYQIIRRKNRSIYFVTDGTQIIEAPILWAFGHGEMGQTYVFEHGGKLYESRVSFYSAAKNLDITLGAPRTVPATLKEAAGREMDAGDVRDCFGCHATNVSSDARGQLGSLVPGVRCESCHGPGEKHVAAMSAGKLRERNITNLKTLSTEEQLTFCGACHRTWEQVMLLPNRGGIDNVRFQPYRLTNSRCYDTEDRRISCTACHNPHEDVRRDAAFYDAKCTACHAPNKHAKSVAPSSIVQSSVAHSNQRNGAPPCPTGRQLCVTCHMPKVEVPGAHFKFTDHHIRVVKPNNKFPV